MVTETIIPRRNGPREAAERYGVAVLSVVAGLLIRLALARALGTTLPYMTLFPAVMFASWFGGFGPGVVAAVLSLVAAFYFIIPPFHRLFPDTVEDTAGAIVFMGVSIFVIALNERVRRARARSDERLRELTRLQEQLTEAKGEAERARDLLQTTLASIGDAVIAADAEGRVTFLNKVAEDLTGWKRAEALGKEISQVFHSIAVGLANQRALIHRDGREIPIEDRSASIRDESQRGLGTVRVFRDVTERTKAEQAVERGEERLKLALDAGRIGVWDWDVTQNRIEWSDRVYEIHGVERGKFPGGVDDFARLVHPEDREQINLAIGAALSNSAPYDVEFRVVHPDGNVVWVSTTGQVFRDAEGAPTRMLGATTDVTARKRAEADLRQQWHTFDVALSNTPDFTYVFDLDGRFTYVNRALLALWQRPLADAVGKNFFDLEYPPELAERLQRQIQQVIDTKMPLRDQTPFTGPTGETGYYEYIFVPVFAAGGQVEAVAGSTRDVTERNRAESALRASEERLNLALEAGGGVGTWDWDLATDRVICNAQFAKLFSVDPASAAAGAPLNQFIDHVHPDDRGHLSDSSRRAIDLCGDLAEEYRVVQGDGSSRWVYARGRCHADAAGKPVRFPGVAFDITDRKRVEEDLRQSNEELKRVNRELEEFAYVASHDLQEPLRMVNIYTQIILKTLNVESAELDEYADFVRQGVRRMESLIHDLLSFSRAVHSDELPVGKADLSVALSEALSVLKNRIEESGSTITAQPLPTVKGDTPQMAHVFQNLISNALKYHKPDLPPQIDISATQRDGYWIIAVRDHGIGFEPQYAERIFGLFKRLHKDGEYPGTGLGLAICKRIVERYGGRIWAEGEPGVGAAFYFSLPPSNIREVQMSH